jgi:membrane-bound ClpP family serine protease
LAGKTGITLTPLVPAGKAKFGDDIVDVVSDGELIDRGATIYVAEVLGNRVVVKPAPGR